MVWPGQRIAVLAAGCVVLAAGGCSGYVERLSGNPYRADTSVRVIRRFFAENPIDEVDVSLVVSGGDGHGILLEPGEARAVAEALRSDTHPLDTRGTSVVGLAANGGVNLVGPLYSLEICISGVGFSLISTQHRFTNPSLAQVLRGLYGRRGALKGVDGRNLASAIAVGGDGRRRDQEFASPGGVQAPVPAEVWEEVVKPGRQEADISAGSGPDITTGSRQRESDLLHPPDCRPIIRPKWVHLPRRGGAVLHADYHRKRLRTTNMLENLNKQVKRRTRVAGLFPNTESALRLVTAVLMEQSQEWETGKVYLTMTEREKASTTVMRDDPKANLQKRSCSATLRVRT